MPETGCEVIHCIEQLLLNPGYRLPAIVIDRILHKLRGHVITLDSFSIAFLQSLPRDFSAELESCSTSSAHCQTSFLSAFVRCPGFLKGY
jgi:hypothetical protein